VPQLAKEKAAKAGRFGMSRTVAAGRTTNRDAARDTLSQLVVLLDRI
jgi:hypothetical protein